MQSLAKRVDHHWIRHAIEFQRWAKDVRPIYDTREALQKSHCIVKRTM